MESLEPRRLLAAAPINDAFASRLLLSGVSASASGMNVGATKEPEERQHGFNRGGASVWWTWTAPTDGTLTLDTRGSDFDTLLAVYTGASIPTLWGAPGGGNDDDPAGGSASKASLSVSAGTAYQIAVDGYDGATGNFQLHLSLAPPRNLPTTTTLSSTLGAPRGAIARPDHIVVVIEQERTAAAVGDPNMPYFNRLAQDGLRYTNSHGVNVESDVGSQNGLALYSGSTQGVTDNGRDYVWNGPNLAKSLFESGLSFAGYSESLPADGSQVSEAPDPTDDPDHHPDIYIRAFNPMAQFTDVGPGKTNADVNKTFKAFPTTAAGFASLPTVSFIVPNQLHTTHGSQEAPYTPANVDYDTLRVNADKWLKDNLDGYLQWAKANNSLLIVTGDEGDRGNRFTGRADIFDQGLTTIINGDPDLFAAGTNAHAVDHYRLLRTIEQMYGLAPLGETASVSAFDTDAAGRLAADAPAATSTAGQAVTFTAAIAPADATAGAPTGKVQFKVDGVNLGGPVRVIRGAATSPAIGSLSVGAHSVTASYLGDVVFAPGTAATVTHTVVRAATATTLASSRNPADVGAAITLTAVVSPLAPAGTTPTGSVTFKDGSTTLGVVSLDAAGRATFVTTGLSAGSHALTASYAGDGDDGASISNIVNQVVNGATSIATTTAVASTANPSKAGGAISFTARVTWAGGVANGAVQFTVDGTNLGGPITLIGGAAVSPSIASLAAGKHTVAALFSGGGGFAASSSSLVQTVRPANDDFADRATLDGFTVSARGTNVEATKEASEPLHAGAVGGKSVWWRWTAPASGKLTIDTTGTGFAALLAVYTGTSVSSLTKVPGAAAVGGTTPAKATFDVSAGTQYAIAVDSVNGASGAIALALRLAAVAPKPPTGIAASDGSFSDKVRVSWTGAAGASGYEIWRGTTSSSSRATRIAMTDAASQYDDIDAVPGRVYWYWLKAKNVAGVSGFSSADTGYRSTAAPDNDRFANRIQLVGSTVAKSGTNVNATKESGEPRHAGNVGGHSVWWTWTATASGVVTIDTIGSNFDTLLAVYTGGGVSTLSAVAGGSNDDIGGGSTASRVAFTAVAGTTYQIAVDGYSGATGNIALHLNLAATAARTSTAARR